MDGGMMVMKELKCSMKQQEPILVAIRCTVYNHEPYLRDCLEGFVMQKTNFRFVAVVHDDASTDGSAAIIREYEEKYPDIIKPIYEIENQYSKHDGSLGRIMNAAIDATGAKYIATCEGDDYWTDPLKLQKQVDILEKDESLMMCCTNCSVVDNHSVELHAVRGGVVKDDIEGRYNLRDFFDQGHQYPTLSVVYRNTHRDEVRQKTNAMRNPYMGDWTLWIALLCFGDMYYLDEVTCAYRINPTSLTHDQSKMNQRRLGQAKDNFRLIPLVASCLPDDYQDKKDDLINNTAWMWYRLAIAYKHVGQYFRMAYALLRCELKDPGYVRREISLAKKKL